MQEKNPIRCFMQHCQARLRDIILLTLLLTGSPVASVRGAGIFHHPTKCVTTGNLSSDRDITASSEVLSLRCGSSSSAINSGTNSILSSSYSEDAVARMWRRQLIWKKVADRQWLQIRRSRLALLNLTVIGAALQTGAKQMPPRFSWLASLAGGGCVGLVPYISSKYLGSKQLDIKKRSYAAHKAIEAEVYLFRVGASPYDDRDDPDRIDKLVNHCSDVSKDVKDLYVMYALAEANTKQGTLSEPPPPLDRMGYLNARVYAKIEQYKKKAVFSSRKVQQCKYCQNLGASLSSAIGLIAGGAGDGIAAQLTQNNGKIFKGCISPWGAVASTASVAIAAHVTSSSFADRSSDFLERANRLENLVFCLDKGVEPGSTEWDKFVYDCEQTIAGSIGKVSRLSENSLSTLMK